MQNIDFKLTLTVRYKQIGGQYANGHIAAVENTSGAGKTLLIGTFPGGAYFRSRAPAAREFLAGLLVWAGVQQQAKSGDPEVKARLHQGAGGQWNCGRNPAARRFSGNSVSVTVGDRDAAVIRLE